MPLDNAQRQALWRTRRQQERALVVERLRTWANAVANADLVPETLPGVAQEMVDLANQLALRLSVPVDHLGKPCASPLFFRKKVVDI